MRNTVVALFCVTFISSCSGPMGPIAGGELEGTPTAWPEDWSFTDDIENVLVQTNPEDPYSVTIWMVVIDNQPFIASASHTTRWAKNINLDNRVVLSVQGKLIEAQAEQVNAAVLVPKIIDAYEVKYEMDREEFVEEDGVLFQVNRP